MSECSRKVLAVLAGWSPRICVLTGWLLVVLVPVCGCGGPPPVPAGVPEIPAEVASEPIPLPIDPSARAYVEVNGSPEYLIGAGDGLTLTLRAVESREEKVTVRPDGNISFSLIENVQAVGLTTTQLDQALTQELSRFLRDPKVDVEVTEYRSKMVSLLGALQAVITSGTKTGQGRYPLRTRTTVLDAILEAGGTTPDAQLERVQLVRDGRAYTLDLQRVLATGDRANNPELQGGDIIIVPGATQLTKKVVVLGEVKNPDVYLLAEDASLLEAIGRAGGLRESALRDDLRLLRAGAAGPEMYKVNYERITRTGDLEQNLPLKSNDIVYVPRSFLGDVNDVLGKIEPLLNFLLLPATFRDLYTTGGGLRIDTGTPPESGSTIYTRPLPGTTSAKPVAEPQTEEQTKKEK